MSSHFSPLIELAVRVLFVFHFSLEPSHLDGNSLFYRLSLKINGLLAFKVPLEVFGGLKLKNVIPIPVYPSLQIKLE